MLIWCANGMDTAREMPALGPYTWGRRGAERGGGRNTTPRSAAGGRAESRLESRPEHTGQRRRRTGSLVQQLKTLAGSSKRKETPAFPQPQFPDQSGMRVIMSKATQREKEKGTEMESEILNVRVRAGTEERRIRNTKLTALSQSFSFFENKQGDMSLLELMESSSAKRKRKR